jgi:aerobic-type carbon monoxide dehydrogenase small subunit (CoxS/CutS family)
MTDTYPLRATINGVLRSIEVSSTQTLLDALRWDLDLTGSKECCAEGECGACTVLVGGQAVNACLVLAVEVDGLDITTIEGLETGGRLSRLQDAFVETGAIQCGFCIPGMVMAASALLDENPHPRPDEVREGLAGNLCRCAGYQRIVDAVLVAAGPAEGDDASAGSPGHEELSA